MFVIAPLNWDEWMAVLILSFPVIVIDEVLKLISVTLLVHAPPSQFAHLSVHCRLDSLHPDARPHNYTPLHNEASFNLCIYSFTPRDKSST